MAKLESFETCYDSMCSCNEVELKWKWNAEKLSFSSYCPCDKRYVLFPITGKIETFKDNDEDIDDDDDENIDDSYDREEY